MNGLPRADACTNTASMAYCFIDFNDFFINIKLRHTERAGTDAGQTFDTVIHIYLSCDGRELNGIFGKKRHRP